MSEFRYRDILEMVRRKAKEETDAAITPLGRYRGDWYPYYRERVAARYIDCISPITYAEVVERPAESESDGL